MHKPCALLKSQVSLSCCLLLGVAAACHAAESKSVDRPNFLFICVDDLRPALGCYGDPLAITPNIDQLAKRGRIFNHAYAQQAVCGPSRTSVLTGLMPDETEVWHNRNQFRQHRPNTITMPQMLASQGYHTMALGKVFSGNQRELDPLSWNRGEILREPHWNTYVTNHNQAAGKQAAFEMPDVSDADYPDGKLAALAIAKLNTLQNSGRPFFLAVGFFKPHLPFNAPKQYWDLHRDQDFRYSYKNSGSPDAPPIAYHSHRELGGYRGIPSDEILTDEMEATLRRGYYACVSYVDAQVGKLLQALEQTGLDKSTVVILWGDHGFSLGEGHRWCKGTNFELDTRVPLIIHIPEMAAPGKSTNALVGLVDLYPTVVALANINPPSGLAGLPLTKVLRRPSARVQQHVMSQFSRPWNSKSPETMGYSVRTPTHRYTKWVDLKDGTVLQEELYDYDNPDSIRHEHNYTVEYRNQIHSEEYQQVRRAMSRRLTHELKALHK